MAETCRFEPFHAQLPRARPLNSKHPKPDPKPRNQVLAKPALGATFVGGPTREGKALRGRSSRRLVAAEFADQSLVERAFGVEASGV